MTSQRPEDEFQRAVDEERRRMAALRVVDATRQYAAAVAARQQAEQAVAQEEAQAAETKRQVAVIRDDARQAATVLKAHGVKPKTIDIFEDFKEYQVPKAVPIFGKRIRSEYSQKHVWEMYYAVAEGHGQMADTTDTTSTSTTGLAFDEDGNFYALGNPVKFTKPAKEGKPPKTVIPLGQRVGDAAFGEGPGGHGNIYAQSKYTAENPPQRPPLTDEVVADWHQAIIHYVAQEIAPQS